MGRHVPVGTREEDTRPWLAAQLGGFRGSYESVSTTSPSGDATACHSMNLNCVVLSYSKPFIVQWMVAPALHRFAPRADRTEMHDRWER